ncbi:N-acetylmuramoyl-L-alanine amidase family 2 [Bacillus pseudomycoides DSM 12442]|nr:N-acetylmuramoyl-L-alanine amidase family 2 [Bacillus pseudomycoides DSM 12442]
MKRAYSNSNVDVSVPNQLSKPEEIPTAVADGVAYIQGYSVNLRKGPDTSYSVIRQLNKPESYVVWAEKEGWLNLGGNQWIKYNPSYVNFDKKSTVDASIVGKRVVSKVDNLRFYDSPSWQNKDVAGILYAGLGFTIDVKVKVNESPQYKVHNSKGITYYITASESYVNWFR